MSCQRPWKRQSRPQQLTRQFFRLRAGRLKALPKTTRTPQHMVLLCQDLCPIQKPARRMRKRAPIHGRPPSWPRGLLRPRRLLRSRCRHQQHLRLPRCPSRQGLQSRRQNPMPLGLESFALVFLVLHHCSRHRARRLRGRHRLRERRRLQEKHRPQGKGCR